MKKSLILTLALLALLVAFAGSATAEGAPVNDLTTLANYAPDSAPFFFAMRTDPAFITELDAMLARLTSKLPPEAKLPPGFGLDMLLNEFVKDVVDEDISFDELVRPWAGNTMAVYIPSVEAVMMNRELPLFIGIEITDKSGAEAFVDALLGDETAEGYYEVTVREDGVIVYNASSVYDPSVIITTDALFFGLFSDDLDELVLPGEDRVKLGLTGAFQDALAALPAGGYHAVAYLDLTDAVNTLVPQIARELPPALADLLDPVEIMDRLGQQAVGLTVLQERSLVLDVIHTGTVDMPGSPLNLDFLRHVPADTALLAQNNGFADAVRHWLDMLDQLDDMLTDMGEFPLEDAGPFANFRFSHLGTFMQLSFEGSTGLNFDKTLNWMNEDVAMFLSLPTGSNPMFGVDPGFGLEYGLVVATNSPAETTDYIAALNDAMTEMYSATRFENDMMIVPLGDLISMPELANIAVGSNDEVLAAGVKSSVAFALNPGTENIATTPTFMFEQGAFLPDTSVLLYADLAPVRAAFDAFASANPDLVDPVEADGLRMLLSFFDTASITAVYAETGGKIRFSLTMGE